MLVGFDTCHATADRNYELIDICQLIDPLQSFNIWGLCGEIIEFVVFVFL